MNSELALKVFLIWLADKLQESHEALQSHPLMNNLRHLCRKVGGRYRKTFVFEMMGYLKNTGPERDCFYDHMINKICYGHYQGVICLSYNHIFNLIKNLDLDQRSNNFSVLNTQIGEGTNIPWEMRDVIIVAAYIKAYLNEDYVKHFFDQRREEYEASAREFLAFAPLLRHLDIPRPKPVQYPF